MSLQRRQTIGIASIYLGIILAFLSYEVFNNVNPSYPPLIMRGWLDARIPVIPIFVIPYLSFHVLAGFVVPYLSLRFGGYRAFLVNGVAIIVSQLMLDLAYFFFQTEVPRPQLSDKSFFSWILVHVIYGHDKPLNGFPSNHVTWSLLSILALWRLRSWIPRTSWSLIAWFLLIIPATVLLRQHFLIDVYGGIFVAFSVYWGCVFLIEKPDLSLR